MKRISEASVRQVHDQCDIVNVVADFLKLEQRGGRYWGLCPFHHEKTPSFSVDREKGFFYCFGCKKGGSTASFLMEAEKMSYPEALEYMANKAGISLVYEDDRSTPHDGREESRVEMREAYKRIAGLFHYLLSESPQAAGARDYLKIRKLSQTTITEFQLGWAPNDPFWLYGFLKKKGYSPNFLASLGLFSKKNPEYSLFSGRVMFPIEDAKGVVVGFGGRILEGDGPKYLNSPESDMFQKGSLLYGLKQALKPIRENNAVIVCEGYMDVISYHQSGVTTAVAPLGTAFTEHHARILKKNCSRIHWGFDNDDAGRKAIERALIIVEKMDFDSDVLVREGYKDASECLEKLGETVLKNDSEKTISIFTFLLSGRRAGLDRSIEDSINLIRGYFPYMEALSSSIKQDMLLQSLSAEYGVDKEAIKRDFLRRDGPKRTARGPIKEDEAKKAKEGLDFSLMLAIAVNRSYYPSVRGVLNTELFDDNLTRSLYISLEESYRNEEGSLDEFLSHLDDPLKAVVLEKMASEEFKINAERYIQDGIRNLKIRGLMRKSEEIQRSIDRTAMDSDGDQGGLNDLFYEKMYVDAELSQLKGERL